MPFAVCLTDHIKCAHPLGWSLANLALSVLEFKDIYVTMGQYDHALRGISWGVDWLVKAHITASDNPSANVFVGQVNACQSIPFLQQSV
jgi:hypothetical protein